MSGAGRWYTEEELQIAKSVDLTAVARRLGYTVVRVGSMYTLKEMDSIRIYNRRVLYTPPVTPWELETPEVSDLTAKKELPKAGPMTGVKS